MFEFLLELFLQIVLEIVAEVGWDRFRTQSKHPLAVACLGYLFVGSCLGATSALTIPYRFTDDNGMSGWGVLIGAVTVGVLMHHYGVYRRNAGNATSNLATFWGGLSFAFAASATRLLVIICTSSA